MGVHVHVRLFRSVVAVAAGVVLAVSVPTIARADATQTLVDSGSAEAAGRGTTAGIVVLDRFTDTYRDNGSNAHLRFGSASLVKLFIADSVLRRASLGQIVLSQADRDAIGLMLRSSDDAAASRLWSRYGSSDIVRDVIARYSLAETKPPENPRYWGLTQITARDVAAFYKDMLSGVGGLPATDRDYMLSQLRQSTPTGTDGVYQWFGLHDALPQESVLGIKQGWMCCLGDGYIWRHSAGIVGQDARYIVVVLARDPSSAGAAHTEASSTRVVQRMFPDGLVPRVQGAIAELWYASGGSRGPVGLPVSSELPATGGAWHDFQYGRIYWSSSTGAHWVRGYIAQTWVGTGSENGPLGYPASDELTAAGGAWQQFQAGRVYWSPNTGAHPVRGGDLEAWLRSGGETGPLGYPTSEELPATGGTWQKYQAGCIYWSPGTGSHSVRGGILESWEGTGSENGPLGYPVTDEITAAGGAWNGYQNGRMYWSPSTGAHWLGGAILQVWLDGGAEQSSLGYPTSDPRAVAGGTRVDFEHGSLTSDSSGHVTISGAASSATSATTTASTPTSTTTASVPSPSQPATTTPSSSPAPSGAVGTETP